MCTCVADGTYEREVNRSEQIKSCKMNIAKRMSFTTFVSFTRSHSDSFLKKLTGQMSK